MKAFPFISIAILLCWGLLLIFIVTPSKKSIKKGQTKWDKINSKANKLFIPLEFEGEVRSSYKINCGGGKSYCWKVFFRRTDISRDSTEIPIIDYGFVRLLSPDSNVLMTNTYFHRSKEKGGSIKMPIYKGDIIRKVKGDSTFSVLSSERPITYILKPAQKMQGDAIDHHFWEKDLFRYKPLD